MSKCGHEIDTLILAYWCITHKHDIASLYNCKTSIGAHDINDVSGTSHVIDTNKINYIHIWTCK